MGWFFLVGLVLSILLLWSGSGIGFLVVMGGTIIVCCVWAMVRSVKNTAADSARENRLQRTFEVQAQFSKETDKLIEKLTSGEPVSPAAEEHFKQTYNELLPLMREHSSTIKWRLKTVRESEGDYSEVPEVVQACEAAYKQVMKKIRQSRGNLTKGDQLDALLQAFQSQFKSFQQDVEGEVGTHEGLALLQEKADALKAALPGAGGHWDAETIQNIRAALAGIDDMSASMANSDEEEEQGLKTPHEILGVSPTASMHEINQAFEQKANKLDPDGMPDELKEAAETKLKEIQAAYEALKKKARAAGAGK